MASNAAPAQLSEGLQNRLKLAMDIGERTFSSVLFAGFALRFFQVVTLRPWDAMVIMSEGFVVVFIVFRRASLDVSTRPLDWMIALAGTAGPMFIRPGGVPLVPASVGVALMLAGMLFSLWGKLVLRRSFGLAAANRGVVSRGAYAFVRHPIYSGYMTGYIGFFLLNPTLWNAVVYFWVIVLLVSRIVAEERVLSQDPVYAALMSKVRYRLAPGLF